MIEIDGTTKSGSGTLLRGALTLATLLGEPLYMWNIRARREKPGLRPQHRQAVLACCEVTGGLAEGADVGSRAIKYRPGTRIQNGYYKWDIGTGGSTTMLVMTLLPLACFARGDVVFHVSGGLFQDFAPSAYHMKYVLFPMLERMGIKANLEIKRPGYAEGGSGTIEVKVTPVQNKIGAFRCLVQGRIKQIRGIALSSHLRQNRVSDRMAEECRRILRAQGYAVDLESVYDETATREGAALAIWAETETCLIGSDRAGRRGRSSESIGQYVARALIEDVKTGATVDRFLADQIIIYAALAEGVTEYHVPRVTEHIEANLWLVEHILGKLGLKAEVSGNHLLIKGIGYSL